jgi:hypothetical protein
MVMVMVRNPENDPLENDPVETILLLALLGEGTLHAHFTSKAMIIIASPAGILIHRTELRFRKDLTSALESP